MLVRFIAACLIAASVIEVLLDYVVSAQKHSPMQLYPIVLDSIPAVIGIVILIKSRALAEWIADLFE